MSGLYPVTPPFASGWLEVGDGNRIWWEAAGNPEGKPAVILHGGPGSGFSASTRRFFDPKRYWTVGFDQRGCGRSTPHAAGKGVDFSANTTRHLIGDIERLRAQLGISRWLVYGASWGTTLGLAYAEAHPDRVSEMIFAGVTTTRRSEIDWLYRGLAPLFPTEWERFKAGAPAGTPDDGLVAAYNDLLFDTDPAIQAKAARDFDDWDSASLSSGPRAVAAPKDPAMILARSRIVTHFFRHAAWLAEGELLAGAGRLRGIRGVLIQGRLDLQGPLVTAWELARAWPEAQLVVVEGAGHSSGDAGMGEAITAALDGFAG